MGTEQIKKTKQTGKASWGEHTFKITVDNMVNLKVLSKYAEMLDWVTHASVEQQLDIDGVINDILNEALTRRVRELSKKHEFNSPEKFIESLSGCKDGEEVAREIRKSELIAYEEAHSRILSHVPFDDGQLRLFEGFN